MCSRWTRTSSNPILSTKLIRPDFVAAPSLYVFACCLYYFRHLAAARRCRRKKCTEKLLPHDFWCHRLRKSCVSYLLTIFCSVTGIADGNNCAIQLSAMLAGCETLVLQDPPHDPSSIIKSYPSCCCLYTLCLKGKFSSPTVVRKFPLPLPFNGCHTWHLLFLFKFNIYIGAHHLRWATKLTVNMEDLKCLLSKFINY